MPKATREEAAALARTYPDLADVAPFAERGELVETATTVGGVKRVAARHRKFRMPGGQTVSIEEVEAAAPAPRYAPGEAILSVTLKGAEPMAITNPASGVDPVVIGTNLSFDGPTLNASGAPTPGAQDATTLPQPSQGASTTAAKAEIPKTKK